MQNFVPQLPSTIHWLTPFGDETVFNVNLQTQGSLECERPHVSTFDSGAAARRRVAEGMWASRPLIVLQILCFPFSNHLRIF